MLVDPLVSTTGVDCCLQWDISTYLTATAETEKTFLLWQQLWWLDQKVPNFMSINQYFGPIYCKSTVFLTMCSIAMEIMQFLVGLNVYAYMFR